MGSVPRLGRFPGRGNGNPLQYSCLDNPMDRRAWWATLHGVTKSQTQLSSGVSETISSGHCWSHQQKEGHLTAVARRHNPACAVKGC